MNKADTQLLVFAIKKITNQSERTDVVRTILPLLYKKAGKHFSAVQFAIDCNVPTLI